MQVILTWDNPEKTVILRVFIGTWSWDEYYASGEKLNDMMRTVEQWVDIINDLRQQTTMMPDGVLRRTRDIIQTLPPNRGMNVVVGASAAVKMFNPTFKKIYGDHSRLPDMVFFENVEDARAYLKDLRSQTTAP